MRLLPILALSYLVGAPAVLALGVDETNYLHVDPASAALVIATPLPMRGAHGAVDDVDLGSEIVFQEDTLAVTHNTSNSIAFLPPEEMCVIAVELRIPFNTPTNRTQIQFRFFDTTGSLIDEEQRWPASGTTLQAFEAKDFASRFSAVEMRTPTDVPISLQRTMFLSCALAAS